MLALGGLLLAPAAAQSQTIHGMVVEDSTRTAIVGALVQRAASSGRSVATAQTDSAGGFLLLSRRSSSFIIRLRHLSYSSIVLGHTDGEIW